MKKKPNPSRSWVTGVRAKLGENPPLGWIVLEGIKGPGVQILPDDHAYRSKNKSRKTCDLVGNYRIVYEFFRLSSGGKVKISARIAGVEGQALYHEFRGLARALGCPKPKDARKKDTQSVAAWPLHESRPNFEADDHHGMADWVRQFLQNPPANFVLFLAASRNLLGDGT